jgi:GAF domain-containing protein
MERTIAAAGQAKETAEGAEALYRAACQDISEAVGANRVSIWSFCDGNSSVHCQCAFNADSGAFSDGEELAAHDHPKYFETILTEQFIVAPDARNHSATREFTETYFKPNGIYSLLDYIIHRDFKPVGVICCENAGQPRNWSAQDKNYLLEISTFLSFTLHS